MKDNKKQNLLLSGKYMNIIEQIKKAKCVTEYENNISIKYMDTVEFGSYFQNSAKIKEPIEWLVLEKQSDRALLLSKRVIDYYKYASKLINFTWYSSALRNYLNNEFINSAFERMEEKAKILETKIENFGNDKYGIHKECDSLDKIFVLDYNELIKYFGDFTKEADIYVNKRLICEDTKYVREKDCTYNYWVRAGGKYNGCAGVIADYKSEEPRMGYGSNAYIEQTGIRPALWVSYENDEFIELEEVFTCKKYDFKDIDKIELFEKYDKYCTIDKMDSLVLGSYLLNGNNIPIEWLLLYRKDDMLLLLSKYVVELVTFDTRYDTKFEKYFKIKMNYLSNLFSKGIIDNFNEFDFICNNFEYGSSRNAFLGQLSTDVLSKYIGAKIDDSINIKLGTRCIDGLNYNKNEFKNVWFKDNVEWLTNAKSPEDNSKPMYVSIDGRIVYNDDLFSNSSTILGFRPLLKIKSISKLLEYLNK